MKNLAQLLGRQPRVLVVDDEPDVAETIQIYLESRGCEVIYESCTITAAQRVKEQPDFVDIILSDYNNRYASGDHQGGLALYKALSSLPKPPAYASMSGQTRIELDLPHDVPFLRKPFSFREIPALLTQAYFKTRETY